MRISGWVEENGRVLPAREIETISLDRLAACGGEFSLACDEFTARDCYGIYPGAGVPGVIRLQGGERAVMPHVPDLSLEEAVMESVKLRATAGVAVTLSGGVDSALIAVLAGLPCIAVGAENSHDLSAAADAAEKLDLDLTCFPVTEEALEAALPDLIRVLPDLSPMNVEIGITGYFVGAAARHAGYEKILTGQAADELFGGYARYGHSSDLGLDLARDFAGLSAQRERDSAAAGLSGVWYSMPYMDQRVILASRKFSAGELVSGDLRKIALRKVAEKYLPAEIAWKPKKAMQYGSGVTKMLRGIAKKNGCPDTAGLVRMVRECPGSLHGV
jgi:asparagine synthase (glutamine-hydrolysing)